MTSVDLLQLDLAADALGISSETLMRRLDGGGLPEAVKRDGTWTVPAGALTAIAEREGWVLDVTHAEGPGLAQSMPDHLDRYISGSMAANAAVVLAKSQA